MSSLRIRKAVSATDFRAMRRICCETADAGNPISKERWAFWGDWWVGPYEKLTPDWCWVAEESGNIVGYLTGVPATISFEIKKELLFELPTLFRYRHREPASAADYQRMLRRSLFLEKSPFRCFSLSTRITLLTQFPAHLHTNVYQSSRGRGVGRALQEAFERELEKQQVPGLHILCAAGPVPYYKKTGFKIFDEIEFRPGRTVYAMTKLIPVSR